MELKDARIPVDRVVLRGDLCVPEGLSSRREQAQRNLPA